MSDSDIQLQEGLKRVIRIAMAATLVQGGDESTVDINATNIDHFTNYGIIVAETTDALMSLFTEEMVKLGEFVIGEDEPPEHTGPRTVSLANHRNWLRDSQRRRLASLKEQLGDTNVPNPKEPKENK